MNNNYWDNPNPSLSTTQTKHLGLTQFFNQVYTYMSLGLALTGFVAVLISSQPALIMPLMQTPGLFLGLFLAQIALVVWFNKAAQSYASFSKLATLFLVYAALNGVTFSVLFLAYTFESIAQTFFVTALSFGSLSFYGYVTGRDLSGFQRFFFMALIGLLVTSVVSLFWHNTALHFLISVGGVLLFSALTAYDTQRLKNLYLQNQNNNDSVSRLSLQGALILYLDFINLMIYLLRLMGNRK